MLKTEVWFETLNGDVTYKLKETAPDAGLPNFYDFVIWYRVVVAVATDILRSYEF